MSVRVRRAGGPPRIPGDGSVPGPVATVRRSGSTAPGACGRSGRRRQWRSREDEREHVPSIGRHVRSGVSSRCRARHRSSCARFRSALHPIEVGPPLGRRRPVRFAEAHVTRRSDRVPAAGRAGAPVGAGGRAGAGGPAGAVALTLPVPALLVLPRLLVRHRRSLCSLSLLLSRRCRCRCRSVPGRPCRCVVCRYASRDPGPSATHAGPAGPRNVTHPHVGESSRDPASSGRTAWPERHRASTVGGNVSGPAAPSPPSARVDAAPRPGQCRTPSEPPSGSLTPRDPRPTLQELAEDLGRKRPLWGPFRTKISAGRCGKRRVR